MSLEKKSPDMILLEECFKNIKIKNDTDGNLERVKRIIARNFEIDFNIVIVENKTRKFFGMSIYPDRSQLDVIIKAIVQNKSNTQTVVDLWHKVEKWNLEIDSILLYDQNLNANPAEIVAVLLHEIGHIVYSNTVPQRINKVMRMELMQLTIGLKKLVRWNKAQKLFDLVIIEACSSKNFHFINQDAERIADSFVVKMGYGDNLDNFINKLIEAHGNSLVNRPEEKMEEDVRTIINWSVENIGELQFRKSKLRTALETEVLRNPSPYIRAVILNIKKSFFGGEGADQYNTIVAENMNADYAIKVVQEGFFGMFDKMGKVKKIGQGDVDIIEVEAGRIDNEDDKIYVLDLIYDNLAIIDSSLELIAEGKKDKVVVPKDTLLNYKKQLEKIRETVLATPIRPRQYGLFIKYPKGYEG